MAIRAKFVCESKMHNTTDPTMGQIILRAVYQGSAENQQFFNMTPNGLLQMGVLNPAAFDQFEPGNEYYLDITPAN